jgi:alkylation response protein AidB-like acyl-CoA dehydrogenase
MSTDTATFRRFAEREVMPLAASIDAKEHVPRPLLEALAAAGYFGAMLPRGVGGAEMDPVVAGTLHQEIARASASVQGVLNVHNMAAQAVLRWGSPSVREQWLPAFASGTRLAAFALTEPEAGSDLAAVATTARRADGAFVLDGEKRWITCGQSADVFLVLARTDGGLVTLLVSRDQPGFTVEPIRGIVGCRGYMLAGLRFSGCRVPETQLVGRVGFGLSHVAAYGLDAGRYCLAWGCVGVAQACVDASLGHTSRRRQFGVPLREHQLVQRMVSRMVTTVTAARLLCTHAGRLRAERHPDAAMTTAMAKYYASTTLSKTAKDAVQLHGASGCSSERPVACYLRDSLIMEVIEGTTQLQETMIARYAYGAADAASAEPS